MKRTTARDEQIIAILKAHEACAKVPELAPCHGVAEAAICRWQPKFGGMEVSEAKQLHGLEQEYRV